MPACLRQLRRERGHAARAVRAARRGDRARGDALTEPRHNLDLAPRAGDNAGAMARIFLGYASPDKPQVGRLKSERLAAGHAPWLDEDEILRRRTCQLM